MRTLVIGFIGVSLALALVPPTWAQAPATNAPPSAGAPSPPTAAGKTTSGPTGHSYKAHSHRGYGAGEADLLNAQELARLQGTAPAPAPSTPGGNNPTSGTAGPFYPK
jgi:hypothetical protein